MEWSIDLHGECPLEVGSFALRLLQDRYSATIDGYDVSPDGAVSVVVALPTDRWTRRIALHQAQVDRNEVTIERAKQLCEQAHDLQNHSREVLASLRRRWQERQPIGSPVSLQNV